MEKAPVIAPPEIPSKWDIIPIHASDISSYKRCRRYWHWSSPTRGNLRRKVQIYGINTDLWFGTGIHYALEMYYNPIIKRDPVEAWLTWFEVQWNGGLIRGEDLDRFYDPAPLEIIQQGVHGEIEHVYRVKGLQELLPDPIEDEFMELKDLGEGMMEFYKEYAAKNDNFRVIAAESVFSIPLGFTAVDVREDSPNYGKELEVHARGRRDTIIQDLENEQYGLIDHKTKSKIDEAYRASLQKDEQTTNYMWASQEEAKIYGMPYERISFLWHQAMRKVYPKPPTITTRGLPSLDREGESATAEMFAKCIKDNNLQVWLEGNEKAANYYDFLVREGDKRFVERTFVRRNPKELENQGRHIRAIAKEMLSDPAIYPNPTASYLCINCQFRGPCISADDGSDYGAMLSDGYEKNLDR